jgi:succinyl-CoA synthetase alpha subunit
VAVLVGRGDRVIIQGITGASGRATAARMLEHGTPVVGGVTPGKGGQNVGGLPVYESVHQIVEAAGATASFITVPPAFAGDACLEAIDAGLRTVVVYTERVPIHDTMKICAFARGRGAIVLGPNSAGCVSPGEANLSDLNDVNLRPGRVGIVSKSGTLAYEVVDGLNRLGLGQSTVVCLGGDPLIATQFADILPLFDQDASTDAVVLLGEIGGTAELKAATMISGMHKPVVAHVAGRFAPPGKRMGHAGAIVERGRDAAGAKIEALQRAGARVAGLVTEVAPLVAKTLGRAAECPSNSATEGGQR